MGGGVHPTKCIGMLENDENLVETIWASRFAYAKLLKVAQGTRN